jgi:hypothetical protein
MTKRCAGFSMFLLVFSTGLCRPLFAQNSPDKSAAPARPAPGNGAVVLTISARIVESGQGEVWQQSEIKVTIPGHPVGIKLVGENIAVLARFTPYFRRDGTGFIVAQGQIWIEVPNEGIHYQTTVQTIPLEFGEQVYFFPLGSKNDGEDDRIEIFVAASPYAETES